MRNARLATYLIRNQTPKQLVIEQPDLILKLAPLQSRELDQDPAIGLGAAGLMARRDHVLDWEMQPPRRKRIMVTACLAAVGISALVGGTVGSAFSSAMLPLVVGVAVAIICAFIGVIVIQLGQRQVVDQKPLQEPVTWDQRQRRLLDSHAENESGWDLARDFVIGSSQGLAVVIMIFVAVSAPAFAIYWGTELSTVIQFHGWSDAPTFAKGPESFYIVVVRSLQLLLLIVVCLLPALMYFQFDRERLSTMLDRWLHAIFRLDSNLRTINDVDAKYGRRVEEHFGASLGSCVSPPRKRMRDRSPVIICTLLIAIGWILVLLNAGGDRGSLPTPQELFRPAPTPMTMAFLGAYFLSVQVALRGYLRGDLKPKTYNVIAVRIIMAVVLAWSMQVLWGDENYPVLLLSFLAGVTPNTVLQFIREKLPFQGRKDDAVVQSPLTELDEIDVYERTRLEEDGITSVQALARHDLVELILSSRIPIPRIIDWVDQAILHQHLPNQFEAFRQAGVRNATDFLRVGADTAALDGLKEAVGDGKDHLSLDVLRVALAQDEWLPYIKNWRKNDGSGTVQILRYDSQGMIGGPERPATPHEPSSAERQAVPVDPNPNGASSNDPARV